MPLRRYEILLPLRHNDGSPIDPAALEQTRADLVARFHGDTIDPQPLHGVWVERGSEYQDRLIRLTVDVDATDENHDFFVEFKETLKSRFQQMEVWLTYHDLGRV